MSNVKSEIELRLNTLSLDQLKEVIENLTNDLRDEAGVVLEIGLDVLMNKMPEAEYVSFLGSI